DLFQPLVNISGIAADRAGPGMHGRICTVATAWCVALACFGLGACGRSDVDTMTVTMTCSPGGLHLGLLSVTAAACPVAAGPQVYFAALAWSRMVPLSAAAVVQLNTTTTTIKCTTKDKSRAGRVGGSFNESEHTKRPSSSPSITFTSDDEAVV